MDHPRRTFESGLCGLLAWSIAIVLCPSPAAPRVLEFVQQQVDASLFGARALEVSGDGKHVYIGGLQTLAFDRDAATGELAFADATEGASIIAISPEGRHLYTYGIGPLRILARDRRSGSTTQVEAWASGMAGIERLLPSSVALSPDGRSLYVATFFSSVLVFARDPGTGVLSFVEAQFDGVDGVIGLEGARHLAVSPDGAHVYVASSPSLSPESPHAVAVFARDATTGALSFVEAVLDDANGVEALHGARAVVLSPDGSHVYVAGSDELVAFVRDPSTGSLSLAGVQDIDDRSTMTISPDGRHVYVASGREAAVTVYARNAGTGVLSFVETWSDGIADLGGVEAMSVTPDGRHLYVAGDTGDGWAAVFARNAGNGTLGFVASYVGDVEGDADVAAAEDVAASPDGRNLYAVSSRGSVVSFSRSAATGELAYVSEIDESTGADGIASARSLGVSPDGRNVYVASGWPDHALVVLTRDENSGELDFLESHFDDVGGVDGLQHAQAVIVSPDGRHVYVAGGSDNAVAVFARDPATGSLEFVEALIDNVGDTEGLRNPDDLAISPGGEHVYVVGSWAIVVFERDAESGRLSFLEDHFAITPRSSVTVSPDGRNVYFTALGIWVFARDTTTGRLTFLQETPEHPNMQEVEVSPDGEYAYGFGTELVVLARQPATGTLELLEAYTFPRYDHFWAPVGGQSPDGEHLYLGVHFEGLIAVMRRSDDGPCRPSPGGLCLADNRFRVEVDWRNFDGETGSSRGVAYGADESGLLWFFNAENWEMLIKVLDGCSFNERFWVFAAASTDVEYTLRVTDELTGATRIYFNPLGTAAAAITDTEAFATCEAGSAQEPSAATIELASALAGFSGHDLPVMSGEQGISSVPGALHETGRLLIGVGGKCLDAQGGSSADGTPVNIFDCHRGPNQRWQFVEDCGYGGCSQDFEIVGIDDKCLQPGEESGGRTPLVLGPCGGPEDRWERQGFYPERLTLVHSSGLCADVQGANTDNQTPVNLFECHEGANQLWDFHQIRCVDSPIHTCLNRDRFIVEVDWRDFDGNAGRGRVLPIDTPDSGLFWFFTPGNWELLVKVLDGCEINDRFWVFGSATTDVEYTLRVTDIETGRVREYFNPLGRSAPAITDTEAFATCQQ